ncbi:hypothetical protein ACFQ93_43830 [Streptomyces sp. NPDC056601]|uniref:hypothetical protein n=1 Tax=Streptomyces sp. NPDC056601 TaxID=3345875 RepID=UPI003687939C
MPATVIEEPLGVAAVFPDGSWADCLLRDGSLPVFARQLMRALADLVHPHGPLKRATTVREYQGALRHFLPILVAAGFEADAARLTRPRLAQALMALPAAKHEHHVRAVLRRLDDLDHVFADDVRLYVDGQVFKSRRSRDRVPLPAYTETEWKRLAEVCEEAVADSYRLFRRSLTESQHGRHWREGGLSRENIQWTLRHDGPHHPGLGRNQIGVRRYQQELLPLYPGGAAGAVGALFPLAETVFSYQLLFGIRTGIVPDGISDLGLEDIDWAGDATVLLDYVKGRTAAESMVLSRPAVRLLEQWLEHSALARRFMPADFKGRLWSRFCVTGPHRWSSEPLDPYTRDVWIRGHGLVDKAGKPWQIHVHRIRTTFEASRDRRLWTGSSRATIDPNHAPQVEGDHYLAGQSPAQKAATETVIEGAQQDLLRRAEPQVIKDGGDAAAVAAAFPGLVAGLGLDEGALAELIGGERDVFAAGCGDQLSGLHGPKGKPCPARPWVCLLCPLALFAPRHTPNLMRLRAYFGRQWQQMPSHAFMATLGPYAQRLDDLLTSTYFPESVLRQAAAEVSGTDDELPLRPEETTA